MQTFIFKESKQVPMKTMDKTDSRAMREYFGKPPTETHNKEELAALYRAIHYTHSNKMEESMAKMDDQEMLDRAMFDIRKLCR